MGQPLRENTPEGPTTPSSIDRAMPTRSIIYRPGPPTVFEYLVERSEVSQETSQSEQHRQPTTRGGIVAELIARGAPAGMTERLAEDFPEVFERLQRRRRGLEQRPLRGSVQTYRADQIVDGLIPDCLDVESRDVWREFRSRHTFLGVPPRISAYTGASRDLFTDDETSPVRVTYDVPPSEPVTGSESNSRTSPEQTSSHGRTRRAERRAQANTDSIVPQQANLEDADSEDEDESPNHLESYSYRATAAVPATSSELFAIDRPMTLRTVRVNLTEEERISIEARRSGRRATRRIMRRSE
jgi:hypothetical protein